MKSILTTFLCALAIAATAQRVNSDQVNYIISFQSENDEIPNYQEIIVTNVKDKTEIYKKFTNAKGRVKFILSRGETYRVEYFSEQIEVKIPTKGVSFLTKKIVYKSPSTVVKQTDFDTIVFSKRISQPTKTEALCQLILKDKKGKPLKRLTIWLVQPKIKKVYQATTNHRGVASFLLPIAYKYALNLKNEPNYKTISLLNKPYLRIRKGFTYRPTTIMNIQEEERNDTVFQTVPLTQKPTLKRTLILVTVLDLDGNPLASENVYLQGKKKVYTARTDANGETALMLPKGEHYAVNFEFRDSLEVLDIAKGNYTRTDKIRYKYIGSSAMRFRILQRRENQALWELLAKTQRFRDSLALARSPFSNFEGRFDDLSQADLDALIEKRAEADRKALEENPKYFEEVGDEAAAAFYRNKDKWDDKLIITDLTCSMYPYLDQILSWHVLELKLKGEEKFENQYMFFNDGDGKSLKEKISGATGGFHYTNAAKLEELTNSMKETMSTGCSGDGPENDLEALLDGAQNRKLRNMEIILIADNNSEIRDFELLKSLNVPIRIVLAGTFWGVNEQYLELAYHTKGSVHTLEDDLERLFEMNDGDYVTIGKDKYRIYGGKFLKTGKL
jgi:hypothetical protein